MSSLPAQTLRRIDRICTQFEGAWKSGEKPHIEQFCNDTSGIDAQESSVLFKELMLLELEYRQREGESPSAEEYRARFPDRSDVVGQVWEAHRGGADEVLPEIPGYDVLRRIGRGGMAVVYLARDRRLGRLVALKLIWATDPSEMLVSRFRSEAQAVARLQHPNIVQIYEIGEYRQQPYLALEFVDGPSLAEWIAGNPRPARDAARLVEVLARAVHAAHQHGIVHRDLKPANVLLVKDELVPKIADFGLVKFLDRDSRQTQSDVMLGTASYMAPEQAAIHKTAVGPAADVYALGAILYELITGRPPFKAATVLETALLVRSSEPAPPRQLQPHTPRDLETICLKCLQKEPARRYSSALELADDLRRFIAGEPVRARPIGAMQRTWRWSRRNPRVASLAAAAAGALVLGTIVSSYFAIQASHRAKEAEAKTRQAETVSSYLVNAFRSADPQRDGRSITIAEVLDRAAAQLHDDFADQPLIEAELAAAMAQTYLGLGLSSPAVQLLQRSRDLMQTHAAPDDWRTIATLHLLARAHSAAGEFAKALPLAQEAYQRMRAAVGEEHPETMQTINTLATAYQDAGQMRQALELHEKTLAWARKTLGESDPQTLAAMNNVAWTYQALGDVERALPLYEQALDAFRGKFGADHPYTLAAMHNLAVTYADTNRRDEAIEMLRHVLSSARRMLGERHPNTLATMSTLARVYRESGRLDEAESVLRECVTIRQRVGPDDWQLFDAQIALGGVLLDRGQLAEAEPLLLGGYERMSALRAQIPPENQRRLDYAVQSLVKLYEASGKPDEAARWRSRLGSNRSEQR